MKEALAFLAVMIPLVALSADWKAKVAVSDAVVTVKAEATPDLPDDAGKSGAALTPITPKEPPKLKNPEPKESFVRSEGPVIDVTIWVTADCYPCSVALHEIKTGKGKRKIRFIVQDFDIPPHAESVPYYQWHDGNQIRYRSGFMRREELEALIARTELEAAIKKAKK